MPARQPDRIATEALQGEGSYVVLRRPTHGEIKQTAALRRKVRDDFLKALEAYSKNGQKGERPELDEIALNLQELASYVVEWNWVDDKGVALPVPTKEDWSVMYQLTDEEAALLAKRIREPSEERLKN